MPMKNMIANEELDTNFYKILIAKITVFMMRTYRMLENP